MFTSYSQRLGFKHIGAIARATLAEEAKATADNVQAAAGNVPPATPGTLWQLLQLLLAAAPTPAATPADLLAGMQRWQRLVTRQPGGVASASE
jgi:hypothetical protein